jgi:hypothetical protein
MKNLFVILAMVFAFAFTATAQTATTSQTPNELFVGYSFVRQHVKADFNNTTLRFHEDTDSHGFNAAYTRYLGGSATKAGVFGITGDVGVNFADGEVNLATAMAGVTLKARNSKYVQPYVRALGGVARQHVTRVNLLDTGDVSGSYLLGGGLDVNLKAYSPYKLRFGADYLNTGFDGERQNSLRLTTGIVF